MGETSPEDTPTASPPQARLFSHAPEVVTLLLFSEDPTISFYAANLDQENSFYSAGLSCRNQRFASRLLPPIYSIYRSPTRQRNRTGKFSWISLEFKQLFDTID
jgi:hypothetical protein